VRLDDATHRTRAAGATGLVAFLTAGYPDEDTFIALVQAADRAGCTAIEIGIPVSDPIADGPLIQISSRVALEGGMTLARAIALADGLRREITAPLLFMGYYNPILRMGTERFAEAAASAGVTGVIVPDVPFEESTALRPVFHERDIAWIDLLAPTSSETRITRIASGARGFVYLVSVAGVTGVRSPDMDRLARFVDRVRPHTDTPLYTGFGIADADRARAASRICDGVIIGSALVRIIRNARSNEEAVRQVENFLTDVASAIEPAGGAGEVQTGP
jgi:tryptophan synthase alpha chain